MSDFFSEVGDGLQNAQNNLPDDTTTFAEAIAARFGQGGDVLTARLLPPVVRMPSTPMANLSLLPRPPPPPALPADPEYTAVPPHALGQWLEDPRTLVVDIRPHAAYSSARISRAVSLSVPSTLLKRPMFSLQRLSAMLPSHSARTRFSAWRAASRILVYDADSLSVSDTSNIQGLLRKFRAEAPDAPIALAWVQGGFQAVWAHRRDLVDAVPPTPETETEDDDDDPADPSNANPSISGARVLRAHHLPRAAFALASTTQRSAGKSPSFSFLHMKRSATHGLPATGPALLNPDLSITAKTAYATPFPAAGLTLGGAASGNSTAAFNPFYDAVRQNTELSHGITERLPRRVRRRVAELPFQWLRDIAKRAGPTTPPDANNNNNSGGATTFAGGPTHAQGGFMPYAFRGRPDSSEDESSDSSASASVSSGSRWRGGAPSPFPSPLPSSLSHSQVQAHHARAADVEEGTEALAMQFYRIELAEQRRMMGVMDHHSRESGVVSWTAYTAGGDAGGGVGGWNVNKDADIYKAGSEDEGGGKDGVESQRKDRTEEKMEGEKMDEREQRKSGSGSGKGDAPAPVPTHQPPTPSKGNSTDSTSSDSTDANSLSTTDSSSSAGGSGSSSGSGGGTSLAGTVFGGSMLGGGGGGSSWGWGENGRRKWKWGKTWAWGVPV
ncbi:hypothetical protein B0H19DRAFT_1257199 [Mycena capillaripes]|nr:hypothetical protein B0H19DRAFT_1257199 [Mycena capillaripes]